jgi:hypothetical protein
MDLEEERIFYYFFQYSGTPILHCSIVVSNRLIFSVSNPLTR